MKKPLLILLGIAILLAAAVLGYRWRGMPAAGTGPTTATDAAIDFAGVESCSACHPDQAERWRGSDHDRAMQPAGPTTILGDFDDGRFEAASGSGTFFQRDGRFYTRTDGPDGAPQEFPIAYTFGVDPLQQYLVEFPGGRLQALGIAWDARPRIEGGQRWFHLYPGEPIDHDDELHWTGLQQNWNYMCAECHSTNLQKNFLAAENRFDTTWSDIDVACEACHGPGAQHLEWARRQDDRETGRSGRDIGLAFRLADEPGQWAFRDDSGTARRSPPRRQRIEIETCGRCHSRRTRIWEEYRHGRPLADTHRIALLEEGLYHADGQIDDEVYVYGSFLQSKMYREGVTCSDCHDPHSGRLRAAGNDLCATCHRAATFDTEQHHHHPEGTPGSECVACHMPVRTYMVVDPRHDHSFRVPRPDLSVRIGTPVACAACHPDESSEFFDEIVRGWFEPGRAGRFHWGEALAAGRRWRPDAVPMLRRVIDDADTPGIARATALTLLPRYTGPSPSTFPDRPLHDRDPLVRAAAVGLLEPLHPATRWQLGRRLLSDPVRTVRIEAARVLAAPPGDWLGSEDRALLEATLDEYRQSQQFNADRPESFLNLGLLQARLGDRDGAAKAYRQAIERWDDFIPARVNLADLYRVGGREAEGETELRGALRIDPDNAEVRHALGLLLVRTGRREKALIELEAAAAAVDQPRFAYVYGVALNDFGDRDRAVEILEGAYRKFPGSADLVVGLATIALEAGDNTAALAWSRKLVALQPDNAGARGLLEDLERRLENR